MWPGFRTTRQALGEIVDFGKHRVGNQTIAYIAGSVDRFTVGIFLGPLALGLYAIADRMVAALVNGIAGVISRVAFPVLAQRQKDRESFDSAAQEFLTVVNLITLPAFAGLAVVSFGVTNVLFSPQWASAAPLMAILSVAALVMPTNYVLVAATNALGRPDLVFKLSIAVLVLRVVACLLAAQIGLTAIALAKVIIAVVALPMFLFVINAAFRVEWLRLFNGVWMLIAAAGSMAGGLLVMKPVLQHASLVTALISEVALGILIYVALVWVLAPRTCRKLLQWQK
jgi:O-antigen/teichoic acid export membrane protein